MTEAYDTLMVALIRLYCEVPLAQTNLRMHPLTAARVVSELVDRTSRYSWKADDTTPMDAEHIKRHLASDGSLAYIRTLLMRMQVKITTPHHGESAEIALDDHLPIDEVVVTVMEPFAYRSWEKTVWLDLNESVR